METIYERITSLCLANGTTVTALCRELKGSKGNLSTWKKGNLKADDLIQIADKFNVSIDYLLGRDAPTSIVKHQSTDLAEKYQYLFDDEDFMKLATVYAAAQDIRVKGLLVGYFIAAAKANGVDTSIIGY